MTGVNSGGARLRATPPARHFEIRVHNSFPVSPRYRPNEFPGSGRPGHRAVCPAAVPSELSARTYEVDAGVQFVGAFAWRPVHPVGTHLVTFCGDDRFAERIGEGYDGDGCKDGGNNCDSHEATVRESDGSVIRFPAGGKASQPPAALAIAPTVAPLLLARQLSTGLPPRHHLRR